MVADAVIDWLGRGWLWPNWLDELQGPSAPEFRLAIADVGISLRLHAPQTPDWLAPLCGNLLRPNVPAAAAVVLAERNGWWCLSDDIGLRVVVSDAAVAPALKAALTDIFCRHLPDGFVVHGALIEVRQRRILLMGPPGTGKSTLIATLAASGLGCLSDDIVRIRRDGLALGIPFLPALKAGAWALFQEADAFKAGPDWVRQDGQRVRYLENLLMPNVPARRIAAIGFLTRRPGGDVSVQPVDPGEALRRVLSDSYSPEGRIAPACLAAFAGHLSTARTVSLHYTEASQLIEPLTALC